MLLVGVPVLSLIGSWLALRAVAQRGARRGESGTEHKAITRAEANERLD
ncbi:hypothetical protein [Aromatoleum anaerobium]|uniref:Uncharacterized protein n=1 Tax=Aromatoleum anaerobium TaxID=182180 RepID=A0ABX1PN35_9RHOO|nr:hypothetical protein [Aromatoleum anaerobium]MCK0509148.1 hypothetical protein [Aromatoleum anaerobium]